MSIDAKIPTMGEIDSLLKSIESEKKLDEKLVSRVMNYIIDSGSRYSLAVYTPEGNCSDEQRAEICGFVQDHIVRLGMLAKGKDIGAKYKDELTYFLREFNMHYAEAKGKSFSEKIH